MKKEKRYIEENLNNRDEKQDKNISNHSSINRNTPYLQQAKMQSTPPGIEGLCGKQQIGLVEKKQKEKAAIEK